MSEFKQIVLETVEFMSSKIIVTILLHDDYLEFLIIYGKAEREKFEA